MSTMIDTQSDRFLQAMRGINERLMKAQREVSSGKRLVSPSDAPDSVAALLQVRADIARLNQVKTNLARTETEVNAAEQTLQSAVTLFDRVRTLASTGASGTQTPETRQGIADELQSILDRMVGLANSSADGRYIFAGDADQTAPYAGDTTTPTGISAYQGATATKEAIHPAGSTFKVSMSADAIFDATDLNKNVFGAIATLRDALLSGDEAAMQQALVPLAAVSAHLNSALTFYGNVQSALTEASSTGSRLSTQLSTQLGEIEDADITAAILELEQSRFQQEASYSARAAAPRTSLFDYLG